MTMGADLRPDASTQLISPRALQWLEFALATPAVLWGGWPLFLRSWRSLVNRSQYVQTHRLGHGGFA